MSIRGYAIKHRGEIDVRTVSTTETGAKINWLYHTVGPAIAWVNSEEQTNIEFKKHIEYGRTGCIKVNIEEIH